MLQLRPAFCALFALVLTCGVTPAVARQTDSEIRLTNALKAMQAYRSTHLLVDLVSAVSLMDGTIDVDSYNIARVRSRGRPVVRSTLSPAQFIEKRRNVVNVWIELLSAIEGAYDPTFNPKDPKNVPQSCIIPPGGLLCGADPKEVQDPQARANYVAEIRANELIEKRSELYLTIGRLDGRAMTGLKMTLDWFHKVAPDGVTDDFSALDTIVRQAGLSNVRRTLVDSYIYATPIPSHTPQ